MLSPPAMEKGSMSNHPLYQPSSHEVGRIGEDVCAGFLIKRGYKILERNWRCVFGEADLVALDDEQLVLVEVKTRLCLDEHDTMPELAVDERKRKRYRNIALAYMTTHPHYKHMRFDVAGVRIVREHLASVRYFENIMLESDT